MDDYLACLHGLGADLHELDPTAAERRTERYSLVELTRLLEESFIRGPSTSMTPAHLQMVTGKWKERLVDWSIARQRDPGSDS